MITQLVVDICEGIMKIGDFVDVHFDYGCVIGRLISDEGNTVTVEFDNGICE